MKDRMMARVTGVALLMVFAFVVATQAKQTKAVERGMTREQVLEIYGKPLTKCFNDTLEVWRYIKSRGGLLDTRVVSISVGFDNQGRVVYYDENLQDLSLETSVPTPSVTGRAPFGKHVLRSLPNEAFDILYGKVKKASFDSNRLDLIEVAALGGYFSCGQCARLISIFSFSDGRMKALAFLAPRVVDPQNASDIYRVFTFGSDRDKAAEIMRSAGKCD